MTTVVCRRRAAPLLALVAALVLPAGAAGAAPTGPYAALGDSYSAAPLVLNQVGKPTGCLRSDHNYPSIVAAAIHASPVRDVTCSAATTVHMTAPQAVALGTNAPQFDALTSDTALVTIGIGGNDVGLVGAATKCIELGLLAPTGTACRSNFAVPGGGDRLVQQIAATAPRIAATLHAIHLRSPRARVLLVGYPHVAPSDGRGCYPLVPLSDDDISYLDTMLRGMNAMLAQQAAANDAEYVDTYDDSAGHDVCTLPGTRWFEGLVPTSPAYPLHPNALGEASMARSVLRVLGEPRPAPKLSDLRRTRRAFAAGRAAHLTYDLDRAVPVTLALQRATLGRRAGTRCAIPSRANHGARACRRWSRVLHTIVADGRLGDNSATIASKLLGRAAALWRVTATASGGAGQAASAAQRIDFRVTRKP
jgi:lysophospholipase L1-like esterase